MGGLRLNLGLVFLAGAMFFLVPFNCWAENSDFNYFSEKDVHWYNYPGWNFRRTSAYKGLCLEQKNPSCELLKHLDWGYEEYIKLKKLGDLNEFKIDDIIRRIRFDNDSRVPGLESAKWLIKGIPAFEDSHPGPLFSISEILERTEAGDSCLEFGVENCMSIVDYKLRLFFSLEKVGMLDPEGSGPDSVARARKFSNMMSNVLAAAHRLQSSLGDYNTKAEVFTLGHVLFTTPQSLSDWHEVLQSDSVLLSGDAHAMVNDLLILIQNYPQLKDGLSHLVSFSVENPLIRILYGLFTGPHRDFGGLAETLFHNSKRIKLHADFILQERLKVWRSQ